MDQIRIEKLQVYAHHGVFPEEAKLGQRFTVSAVLCTDIRRPGLSDDLANTIDYGAVCREIVSFMTENRFQLIEACCEQLAERLLLTWPDVLNQVDLEIQKPWAPIGLPLETAAVRISRGWHDAYLALGSNMGDRQAFLQGAVDHFREDPRTRVQSVSTFIETASYGYTDQAPFLNGVMRVRTTLSPDELLDRCHEEEQAADRVRKIHWGPRTLDLDILFYDDEIIGTERLVVPHPDMAARDFVLKPMAEIAPWKVHPVTGKTMARMLRDLEEAGNAAE